MSTNRAATVRSSPPRETPVASARCATVVPTLVGGEHPRIVSGPDVERALSLGVLLEDGGTLLGRWLL